MAKQPVEEQIAHYISTIGEQTDDQLVHAFKIVSSKTSAKDKKLYGPVLTAINKERRKRGTITISSKIVPVSGKKTTELGASPDDY